MLHEIEYISTIRSTIIIHGMLKKHHRIVLKSNQNDRKAHKLERTKAQVPY